MKKKLFGLLIVSAMAHNIFAQSASKSIESEETFGKKGLNTVNVYYGVSVFNNIYKNVAKSNGVDLKYSGFGPIGIMYEHFVTDKIGIGVEFGYNTFKISSNYEGTDQNFNVVVYEQSWTFNTFRAMGRANFHFSSNKNFDAYFLVAAGYRNSSFVYKNSDPLDNTKVDFNNIIPFGIKPGLGIRYFFTGNIGLHAEVALGSPLISGGISAKF